VFTNLVTVSLATTTWDSIYYTRDNTFRQSSILYAVHHVTNTTIVQAKPLKRSVASPVAMRPFTISFDGACVLVSTGSVWNIWTIHRSRTLACARL